MYGGKLKNQAIELRRNGFSYSEILKEIPVAKSTLSLWLHSVELAQAQKQRLTEKRLWAAKKGGEAKRNQRLSITNEIKSLAKQDINAISNRELWLMGCMLYWAEGSKEKENRPGSGIIFSNSDPFMIKLFLIWLTNSLSVASGDIRFSIYIHDSCKDKVNDVIRYWSAQTGFSTDRFDKIYYKKHKVKTKRKNTGDNYYGLLRVRVIKSSKFNRKISGWIEGICYHCRVV